MGSEMCIRDSLEPVRPFEAPDASPVLGRDSVGRHWRYTDAESKAIWFRGDSYKGDPHEE